MLKISLLAVLACACCFGPRPVLLSGTMTLEKPANDKVEGLVDKVRDDIEKEVYVSDEYFKALSYRTQLVNGVNYFVKRMPMIQIDIGIRGGVIYLLLLLAIPVQYYLSNKTSVPEEQRDASFRRLLKSLHNFRFQYLSVSSWQKWCVNVLKNIYSWKDGKKIIIFGDSEDEGESPAIEVFLYKSPQGHFATSPEVRSKRPPEVKYRVGQVIRHKIWGYRGVIIGWDKQAKAPEAWLDHMHPPDKWHWRKMPNYSILVDTRDREEPQVTYIPQENLEVITQFEVEHPSVDDYFDHFDGAQYIMRPALRHIYPRD